MKKEIVTKAKVVISKEFPFLTFLLYRTKINFIRKKGITAYTDGREIYINESYFFKELESDRDRLAVILHELLHIAFLHLNRYKKLREKNHMIWNIATDLKINRIISQNPLFHNSVLYLDRVVNLNINRIRMKIDIDNEKTEEIYYKILESLNNTNMNGNSQELQEEYDPTWKKSASKDGYDSIKIDPSKMSEFKEADKAKELSAEEEQEVKTELEKGIQYAKQIGHESVGMNVITEEVLIKKINWKQILKKSLENMLKAEYSWKKYHRKTWIINAPLPATQGDAVELGVVIDTSGSVSSQELGEFLSAIKQITEKYHQTEIKIAFIDTEVVHEEETQLYQNDIKRIESIFKKAKGGGGTNMIKGMEWAVKNNIKQLVIFTDGYTFMDGYSKYRSKIKNLVWVVSSKGDESMIREVAKNDKIIKISR